MALTDEQLDSLLKEVDFPIRLCPERDRVKRFDRFADLSAFIDTESQFWELARAPSLRKVVERLTGVSAQINHAKTRDNLDEARRELERAKSNQGKEDREWIFSETRIAGFLRKLDEVDPTAAEAATCYATGRMQEFANQVWNHPSYIKGILAYIYQQDPGFLDQTSQAQADAVDRFVRDLDSKGESLRQEFAAATTIARKTQEEASARAEENLSASRSQFDEAFSAWKASFELALAKEKSSLEALESRFKERVRLLKPAEYWGKLARKYDIVGLCWIGGAVASCGWLVRFVSNLLWFPPDSLNKDVVTLSGLKGALIATAAISMLIYLTHLCVRVAVSSFHLARDARERHQLTHVFLALLDEVPFDKTSPETLKAERTIVYQALFSRADTGLLKNDGAPVMPGTLGNWADLFKK